MLVEIAINRKARHVEVGVVLIPKLLELLVVGDLLFLKFRDDSR